MPATIVDIALKAGVGESTAGRALRGTGYVSAKAKARVLKIAAELNYQPNHMARSLRLGKSAYVAMVAWYVHSPTYQVAFQSAEEAVRNAGYALLFHFSTTQGPDAEKDPIEELLSKRVAGAVISPASNSPDRTLFQRLLDNGVKLVVMDKIIEGLGVPHVVVDQYASGRLATEHLISLGHRNIVYLGMSEESPIGRQRAAGFRDAMRTAGLPVRGSSVIETDLSEEGGAAIAMDLLRRQTRPTALVARHDVVAIGAVQALLGAGLSIPGDISIVGHGDIWPCHALCVPLTTIHAPMNLVALTAVEKLLSILAGKPLLQETTALGVDLVVRSSTGPPCR